MTDLVEGQHLSGHLPPIQQGYSHPVVDLDGDISIDIQILGRDVIVR